MRSFSARHFIIRGTAVKFLCVCLLLLAPAAYATDPYQYITPTGNSTTDMAAMNAALPSCATGKAIFILPGGFAAGGSAIDLSPYPGCAILGSQVGTGWDSSSGTQNTSVSCSGASCFILGNSNVLRGFSIFGGSSTVCLDLTTHPASGNLFLDLNFGCATTVNIHPASCCSQNNRFINLTNFALEGSLPGVYCGVNCRFNQIADYESPAVPQGIDCDIGCTNNQFTNTRAEDNNSNYFADGTDDIMTALNNSQIICIHVSGSNQIIFSARCSGPVSLSPAIVWNTNNVSMSNVIIRDVSVLYNTTYDNTNGGGGSISCSNCILDYQGFPADSATAAYDNATTEASLDWQRPQKTHYLQAISDLPGATVASNAPDFQFSPNHIFVLSASCVPCTITNPVYAHDGQHGFMEVQQGTAGGGGTITWGTGYTVSSGAAAPDTAAGATTYYPYTVSGTQVVLGNSYSSGPPINLVPGGDSFATGWTATNSATTGGQTDPNSGTTAVKLIENTANGIHEIDNGSVPIPNNQTYTCAVYYKALGTGATRLLLISIGGTTGGAYAFADTSGAMANFGTSGTATGLVQRTNNIGSGWWRAIISVANLGAGSADMTVGLAETGPVASYTGDGVSGLFAWRPTCVLGSSP